MSLNEAIHYYKKISKQMFHQPSTLEKFTGASRLMSSHAYYDVALWEQLMKENLGYTRLIDTAKFDEIPKVPKQLIINQVRGNHYNTKF